MNEDTKLTWLKRVLIFKIVVVALLWGLPTLFGPESFLKMLGEQIPNPPFYMRIFGATQIGLVFLYWLAYQNLVPAGLGLVHHPDQVLELLRVLCSATSAPTFACSPAGRAPF